jgi:tRNA(Ile)-lysidine synthase
MNNLMKQVELRIEETKLIRPGDAVVVAVSGGPDSVAMLHVLFLLSERYSWRLVVAHVNHKFRGDESDAEAAFVAELAKSYSLPCEIGNIDVPAYIDQTSLNAQVAAREKRYEFLHEVANRYHATRVALAHHADDQAETIMMRILRGTGPSGLAGMPERRVEKKVELVRPFLRIYKAEVVQYCREHGLEYCMDSSNELRKYARNQIRLDVMPFLRSYNEQLPVALNRMSEMMRAEDDFVEEEAAKAFATIVSLKSAGCRFLSSEFAQAHVALQRRMIKLILAYLSLRLERFDFARLELIRSAILQRKTPTLQLDIGEQYVLIREYDEIRIQASSLTASGYCYELMLQSGDLCIQELGSTFRVTRYEKGTVHDQPDCARGSAAEAWFDLDQLEGPIFVRSRQAGDRIEPFGLNGSKKVKDMFIDAKIPPSMRDTLPLVVDGRDQILWIPHMRRSRHAVVKASTTHLLHMALLP